MSYVAKIKKITAASEENREDLLKWLDTKAKTFIDRNLDRSKLKVTYTTDFIFSYHRSLLIQFQLKDLRDILDYDDIKRAGFYYVILSPLGVGLYYKLPKIADIKSPAETKEKREQKEQRWKETFKK